MGCSAWFVKHTDPVPCPGYLDRYGGLLRLLPQMMSDNQQAAS